MRDRVARLGLMVAPVLTILFALAAALAIAVPSHAREPVLEVRLADNVFVIPDKYAKSVTGWLVVRAGCADEAVTCQGIAHYLEHLLFINRDADHRSKVALFPAGSGNGWTSHTGTGYMQSFPVAAATKAEHLDKLVAYLAGLLDDVRADEAQAARERNIVQQENFQRVGNSPQARFGERRTAALLPDDPLGKSVGGSPETIRSFDIPRARDFQRTWYVPNNAAFVFSGPIGAEELRPLVERYIAPLRAREVPPRPWLTRPAPRIETLVVRDTDKDLRQPLVTYDKIVTFAEPASERDQLVLNAARGIVASFFASRRTGSPMYEMIDKTELIATGGFSVQRVRPGMLRLSFSGTPVAGIPPERLAAAVKAYVDGLKPGRIPPAYITRLKSRAAVGRELLAAEPARYASSLVSWLQGIYPYEEWRDRYHLDERVDRKMVDQVLRILAKPGREVTGFLMPVAAAAHAGPAKARAP